MLGRILSFLSPTLKSAQLNKFDNQHVNADICLTPMGSSNTSTRTEIRKAVEIMSRAGFDEVKPHAFGTNVSGTWSTLVRSIEKISEKLLPECQRLHFDLRISVRGDKPKHKQTIGHTIAAVT
ncbi:MAG: hypothetical protein EBR67_08650 [Proteobacteria bacterium]|nr:hypothetical protein [Pseudomonadota bacterium]